MPLTFETDSFICRQQGSYTLSYFQRSAFVLAIDIEVVSTLGNDYENYKTLPPNSFYGYATLFQGASVRETIKLSYPLQRILYLVNWDAFQTQVQFVLHDATLKALDQAVTALGGDLGELIPPEVPSIPALPITKVKVMGDRSPQFNINVHWASLPTADIFPLPIAQDTQDPTDGENEYPNPKNNPNSNPYDGNPEPSLPQNGADPRDYGQAPVGSSGYFDVAWYYQPIGTNDGKGWKALNVEMTGFLSYEVVGNGTKNGDLKLYTQGGTITLELWRNSFYSANCPSVVIRKIGEPM